MRHEGRWGFPRGDTCLIQFPGSSLPFTLPDTVPPLPPCFLLYLCAQGRLTVVPAPKLSNLNNQTLQSVSNSSCAAQAGFKDAWHKGSWPTRDLTTNRPSIPNQLSLRTSLRPACPALASIAQAQPRCSSGCCTQPPNQRCMPPALSPGLPHCLAPVAPPSPKVLLITVIVIDVILLIVL